jgi:hypothetical protein
MVLVLYLVVATILADSLGLTTSGAITDGIGNNTDVGLGTIIRYFGTFAKMLTFQVQGIPVIVAILFFTAPTLVLIYFLVDIIKDLIPFT